MVLLQVPVAVAEPVLLISVDAPHCNCLSGGQVSTGADTAVTLTVFVQVLSQPPDPVTFRLRVNEAPVQFDPAVTLTDCPVVPPTMDPLPEIDQL